MEELQEAIEDAQYMNAIMSDGAPRPTEGWKYPTEEELSSFYNTYKTKNPDIETLEGVLEHIMGFWLFYEHCKSTGKECLMSFIERVIKYKKLSSYGSRKTHACHIFKDFFSEEDALTKFEFNTTGIQRLKPGYKYSRDPSPIMNLHQKYFNPFPDQLNSATKLFSHIKLDLYKDIAENALPQMEALRSRGADAELSETLPPKMPSEGTNSEVRPGEEASGFTWGPDLWDDVEAVILHELARSEFPQFKTGPRFAKFQQGLYLQAQPVREADFTLFRVLGRGGFGLVNGCKRTTTGKLYAMKVMHKKRVKLQRAEKLCLAEMRVLTLVESPFVVCLKYAFASEQDLFLILDLMTGGDLAYHLAQNHSFRPDQARFFAARILLGVDALHRHNLVYRDLKPDNVLLDDEGYCRISDLGLATEVTPTLSGACGTRGYWAPEMLRRENGKKATYDQRVDWFSFGALVYEFVAGVCPFRTEEAKAWGGKGQTKEAMDKATLEMEPDFSDPRFDAVSRDFCQRLLDKDPARRLGANGTAEIMRHGWFDGLDWDAIQANTVEPPLKPKKDINAASQSEIGHFTEDKKHKKVEITPEDHKIYQSWQYTNPNSFQEEMVEFMKFEAEQGPIVPDKQESSCCIVS